MRTKKQIRRRYIECVTYYLRDNNYLNFKDAHFWYAKAYELAWILNRDICKDVNRLINCKMY